VSASALCACPGRGGGAGQLPMPPSGLGETHLSSELREIHHQPVSAPACQTIRGSSSGVNTRPQPRHPTCHNSTSTCPLRCAARAYGSLILRAKSSAISQRGQPNGLGRFRAGRPLRSAPSRSTAPRHQPVLQYPQRALTRHRPANDSNSDHDEGIESSRLDRERQGSSRYRIGDSSGEWTIACSPTRLGLKFHGTTR
jgi:hypothetical protein